MKEYQNYLIKFSTLEEMDGLTDMPTISVMIYATHDDLGFDTSFKNTISLRQKK